MEMDERVPCGYMWYELYSAFGCASLNPSRGAGIRVPKLECADGRVLEEQK